MDCRFNSATENLEDSGLREVTMRAVAESLGSMGYMYGSSVVQMDDGTRCDSMHSVSCDYLSIVACGATASEISARQTQPHKYCTSQQDSFVPTIHGCSVRWLCTYRTCFGVVHCQRCCTILFCGQHSKVRHAGSSRSHTRCSQVCRAEASSHGGFCGMKASTNCCCSSGICKHPVRL